jgi:hypothetical protein
MCWKWLCATPIFLLVTRGASNQHQPAQKNTSVLSYAAAIACITEEGEQAKERHKPCDATQFTISVATSIASGTLAFWAHQSWGILVPSWKRYICWMPPPVVAMLEFIGCIFQDSCDNAPRASEHILQFMWGIRLDSSASNDGVNKFGDETKGIQPRDQFLGIWNDGVVAVWCLVTKSAPSACQSKSWWGRRTHCQRRPDCKICPYPG